MNSQASGTLASGWGLDQGCESFWLSPDAESGVDAIAISANRSWVNRLAVVQVPVYSQTTTTFLGTVFLHL